MNFPLRSSAVLLLGSFTEGPASSSVYKVFVPPVSFVAVKDFIINLWNKICSCEFYSVL